MTEKRIVQPAQSPPAAGPYSHAVRFGPLLFCSGQIGIDPATGTMVHGGIESETVRVLENIRLLLEDQALGFSDILKTTVYMTDLGQFSRMNEIYARYFEAPYPARSTVQVAALPKGAQIEMEVVAGFPAASPA
jgi:2-iminobutanoate/2-iminopropanoate deaminase